MLLNNKRICADIFCSKLNSKMQMQKVWKAIIGRIKGKGGSNLIDHLKVNGILITDKKEEKKKRKKSQKSV